MRINYSHSRHVVVRQFILRGKRQCQWQGPNGGVMRRCAELQRAINNCADQFHTPRWTSTRTSARGNVRSGEERAPSVVTNSAQPSVTEQLSQGVPCHAAGIGLTARHHPQSRCHCHNRCAIALRYLLQWRNRISSGRRVVYLTTKIESGLRHERSYVKRAYSCFVGTHSVPACSGKKGICVEPKKPLSALTKKCRSKSLRPSKKKSTG